MHVDPQHMSPAPQVPHPLPVEVVVEVADALVVPDVVAPVVEDDEPLAPPDPVSTVPPQEARAPRAARPRRDRATWCMMAS
jgi:hypothetical protein